MTTILGIDQSLTCTGFVIIKDGVVLDINHTRFPGIKRQADKREALMRLVQRYVKYYDVDAIVVERARVWRKNQRSIETMIEMAALIKFIIAAVKDHEKRIPVYSADTRSCKSKTVGSAKASKQETQVWIDQKLEEQEYYQRHHREKRLVNDDEADAGCFGLYYFAVKPLLKVEH